MSPPVIGATALAIVILAGLWLLSSKLFGGWPF